MSTLPEDFDTPEDRGPPPEMRNPFLDLRGALTPTIQCQPPEMLFGAGGQDRLLQQVALENITFQATPDPQGPSPVADEIFATIYNAPTMRYVGWNRVLHILRTAPPEGRTPASLVEILQPTVQQEDQIWEWLEDFDEQLSMEALVRINETSLARRIRDLMGIEASHHDPLQTISDVLPDMYETIVRPVFCTIRYIRSADESEATKMHFDSFVVYWKHLKRQLKSNKLAPSMREHLDRLRGRPLPPKREGLSNRHETQRPGEPVIIDLT